LRRPWRRAPQSTCCVPPPLKWRRHLVASCRRQASRTRTSRRRSASRSAPRQRQAWRTWTSRQRRNLDFSLAPLLADAVVVAASGIQVAKEQSDSLFFCFLSICHASGDVACCSAFIVEKCLSSTSGVKNPDFSSTSGVENPDFSSASGVENLDSRSFFVDLLREQRRRLVSITARVKTDFSSAFSVEKFLCRSATRAETSPCVDSPRE
jgi:hypothetical protein